jgi:hypothetical protein
LIRDCSGAWAFDTLLRYRGGTLAELWRALRTLKALQAERAAQARDAPAPRPIEPEALGNPGESEPARPANEPAPRSRPAHPPAARSPAASYDVDGGRRGWNKGVRASAGAP